MGGDVDKIRFIVANHMRIKPDTWNAMRQSKKDKIINDPNYQSIQNFGTLDKGGLQEMIEKEILKFL